MRKIVILCLMVGMLLMGGVVSAQDTPPVFCGTLAQADCSILQQSRTAMQGLKSADINLTFNISAANIPNMPTTEPLNISLTGTGSYSGDMSAVGQPPTSMTDPTASITWLAKALGAVNAKLNLTITIPPAIQQMAAAGSNPVTLPASIPINLVLVDGKGYIDMDSLGPVIAGMDTTGSATSMPKGWVGLDLVEALNQMAPMMSQVASLATQEAVVSNDMAQFMDPAFIGKFVKIERGADATVNGDAVAVFNTTVDVSAMIQDPTIAAAMSQAMHSTGSESSNAAQIQAMLPVLAQGLSITATTEIGTADNIVRSAAVDFSYDATSIMALMATPEASPQPAPVVKVHFDYGLSNINSAQPITAPEGATVVPLSSLMGGGMSGIDTTMSGMDTDMSGLSSDMSGLDSMMQGMDSMMATPAASG